MNFNNNEEFIKNIKNVNIKNAFINNEFNPIMSVKDFLEKSEIIVDTKYNITNFILYLCLYNEYIYVDNNLLKIIDLDSFELINRLCNKCILGYDFNIFNNKEYIDFYNNRIKDTELYAYFPTKLDLKINKISPIINGNIIINSNCLLKLIYKKKFKFNKEYSQIINISELFNEYKMYYLLYRHITQN